MASLGGNEAGEFFAGDSAAGVKPYLKLADSAFTADNAQFFGGEPGSPSLPASFQVILHEVGHAVETEELRAAREDYDKASAEVDEVAQANGGGEGLERNRVPGGQAQRHTCCILQETGRCSQEKRGGRDRKRSRTSRRPLARWQARKSLLPRCKP